MKISIITVCYNSVDTISKTLRSVAEQDHNNIEHIIIDGGSTDGTNEIILQYKKGISKIISERDLGIYDAMNKGLEIATGDIVGFLNSDDYYKNSKVLSSIDHYITANDLDAIYGDVEYFSPKDESLVTRKFISKNFSPEKIKYGFMPAHPALFVKRNIAQKVGRFNIKYKIAGDFEFIARLFQLKGISYMYFPEILVRMQSGGVSNNGFRSKIQVSKEMLMACKDLGLDTNIFKILIRYPEKIFDALVCKIFKY